MNLNHGTGDNLLDAGVGTLTIVLSGIVNTLTMVTPLIAFLSACIGLIVVSLSVYNQWQLMKQNRRKK